MLEVPMIGCNQRVFSFYIPAAGKSVFKLQELCAFVAPFEDASSGASANVRSLWLSIGCHDS
jgi:hypothetical protein